MSENMEETIGSQPTITQVMISDMLVKNFEKLPDADQKLFTYAPLYLGGNSGLAGLISNSLYRRVLNIRPALIASSLPMAVLPFLTTCALYEGLVSKPLLSGDLNCPSCALMRGALVGVVGGGLHPVLMALPLNIGLATRYSTTPLPEKGQLLRYCVDISKPVFNKLRAVLVIQAVFGTYMGSKSFQSYTKLVQITSNKGEVVQE